MAYNNSISLVAANENSGDLGLQGDIPPHFTKKLLYNRSYL